METIEQLAKRGEQHDVMDALRLLTNAYIEMCGSSISYRTVVFWAAEKWQEILAWLDLPLSETARKCGLVDFMPYINKKFAEWGCKRYDIAGMNKDERLDCCKQIVNEKAFDEKALDVLCWGFLESIKKKKMPKSVTAIVQDGIAIKGSVDGLHCGRTIMYMETPYKIRVTKNELVRDLKELLIEAYNDVPRLRSLEDDVRALYPKYQEELGKVDSKKRLKKHRVFSQVYGDIISNSVISSWSISELFNEWWGLEFYKWE